MRLPDVSRFGCTQFCVALIRIACSTDTDVLFM